jgi:malonate-semialdehyde dehydrogenase (acetylating) / methylmalonate-semialdehyde dehydrogenase
MKIGPTHNGADVDMGPVITRKRLERLEGSVDIGHKEGAEVALDGRLNRPEGNGFLIGPSVLDHVEPAMRVARGGIFGPVLSVLRVDDLDQAPWRGAVRRRSSVNRERVRLP